MIVDTIPTRGRKQPGTNRPCVVIQNDVENQYSPTTIVAPLTTQYDPADIYPFELEVRSSNTTLDRDAVADLGQIRVVDIDSRVRKNIGSVPADDLAEIDSAIKASLEL